MLNKRGTFMLTEILGAVLKNVEVTDISNSTKKASF
jgi:hypothetical protein